jgi:hypothetical protein
MISMTWTAAPAGFLGLSGSDPRTYAVRGTAVPFGRDRRPFVEPAGNRLVVEVHVQKPNAPTTGTTLGIPSSRRPLS